MHVVCSFTTVPGFTGWKIWRRLRAQGAGLVVAGRMTGTRLTPSSVSAAGRQDTSLAMTARSLF